MFEEEARETSIVETIRDAIQDAIPGSVCRKRHVTMGLMGDPDLYGCLPGGRHFEIEVKRRSNTPSKLQLHRMGQWKKAGAIVGVAHDAKEALEILTRREANERS